AIDMTAIWAHDVVRERVTDHDSLQSVALLARRTIHMYKHEMRTRAQPTTSRHTSQNINRRRLTACPPYLGTARVLQPPLGAFLRFRGTADRPRLSRRRQGWPRSLSTRRTAGARQRSCHLLR